MLIDSYHFAEVVGVVDWSGFELQQRHQLIAQQLNNNFGSNHYLEM